MALESAKAFLNLVEEDCSLQGILNVVDWNPRDTAEIAAVRGFEFSAEEIEVAIDETWSNLSEEKGQHVSG
ncbi:MAG: Nif11-like leader peptide family natural product precursor [Chloroflexota bacterium]